MNLSPLKPLVPYAIVAAVALAAFFFYQHQVSSAYSKGLNDGMSEQKRLQELADLQQRQRNEEEKKAIEDEAKHRIDQAEADAAIAHDASRRLQQQLDRIKLLAGSYSPTDTSGSTAEQTVRVLADLFSRADARAGALAKFADSTFEAGLTCERQYDSLRIKYEAKKSSSNDN